MVWRMQKKIGITEAIRKIGVSPERLRYWELKNVVKPSYIYQGTKKVRRYSQNDIDIALEIKRMIDKGGYTLKGAAERLNRPYRGE